jgi:predicted esterase
VDRPILILHGEDDTVVDIGPQREFYESLKSSYSRKDLIMMTTYKQLDHYVTTNMMEEMGRWLEKYL